MHKRCDVRSNIPQYLCKSHFFGPVMRDLAMWPLRTWHSGCTDLTNVVYIYQGMREIVLTLSSLYLILPRTLVIQIMEIRSMTWYKCTLYQLTVYWLWFFWIILCNLLYKKLKWLTSDKCTRLASTRTFLWVKWKGRRNKKGREEGKKWGKEGEN